MMTSPAPATSRGTSLWVSLAACMAVGPLVLYSLSALAPVVIDDLSLSPAEYGTVSTVTYVAAALTAAALGGLSGRVSPELLMVLISFGAGLGFLLLAAATTYAMILLAALVAGAAQALSNPATNRAVAALPPDRRGALVGWKQSGVQMSQLAAGLLLPSIAVVGGWRLAVGCGAVLALAGVISARRVRFPEPAPSAADTGTAVEVSVPMLTAYTFCMGMALQATNAYLPLFAHERLGLGVRLAGLTAAVVGGVGIASRIWWGRQADREGSGPRTFALLAGGAAVGVALILLSAWAGTWLVWIGAGVFGAAALASNSVSMSVLLHSIPSERLSVASGVVVTGLYFGFAAGPLSFGLALDSGLPFEAGWVIPLLVFAVAAVFGARAVSKQSHHQPVVKGSPC